MGDHSISARYWLTSPGLRGGLLGAAIKESVTFGSDVPDWMAEALD
jgi:hypothetical protein